MKKVFPRINALCHERGTYCAPVDLRWGINDSQTNSGLIIQLCLDYIDRCAPFFICLVGERYGSHRPVEQEPLPVHYDDLNPSCHWLDRNLVIASSAGYDWVSSPGRGWSLVTSLYGYCCHCLPSFSVARIFSVLFPLFFVRLSSGNTPTSSVIFLFLYNLLASLFFSIISHLSFLFLPSLSVAGLFSPRLSSDPPWAIF